MTGRSAEAGVDLPRLRAWIVANGGEVLADRCTDSEVHYRSIEGLGSVTLTAVGPAYTGNGRLALTMSRIGSTLHPFAIGPEPALIHRRDVALPVLAARRTATIISDASLCHETGAAGWASWMIAGGKPSAVRGGPIEVSCASSDEAELIAIVYALRAAMSDGYAADGAEVLIQSDSANALALVRKAVPSSVDRQHATRGVAIPVARKVKHTAVTERYANEVGALARKHSLSVHVRHVPGHTAGEGRQWVNRQCDRIAKKHMRARRAARRSSPDNAGGGCGG